MSDFRFLDSKPFFTLRISFFSFPYPQKRRSHPRIFRSHASRHRAIQIHIHIRTHIRVAIRREVLSRWVQRSLLLLRHRRLLGLLLLGRRRLLHLLMSLLLGLRLLLGNLLGLIGLGGLALQRLDLLLTLSALLGVGVGDGEDVVRCRLRLGCICGGT